MPQEESKRGAHFAKGASRQAPTSHVTSVDNCDLRVLPGRTDSGETAVFLRAAGVDNAEARSNLTTACPEETAVFLMAAQGNSAAPLYSDERDAVSAGHDMKRRLRMTWAHPIIQRSVALPDS